MANQVGGVQPLPNPAGTPLLTLRIPIAEWHIIIQSRPNVLIRGEKFHVEQTLLAILAHLQGSVFHWHSGTDETLPPDDARTGTLVIAGLDELTGDEVSALEGWLLTAGASFQVISTSRSDLGAAVELGRFPASLYYRLNTILLESPGA